MIEFKKRFVYFGGQKWSGKFYENGELCKSDAECKAYTSSKYQKVDGPKASAEVQLVLFNIFIHLLW